MDREIPESRQVNAISDRLVEIVVDVPDSGITMLQDERIQAIQGLLEFNHFKYLKEALGPYKLRLSIEDGYLVFRLKDASDNDLPLLAISPRPYKKLIQDYFMMVESYEQVRATDPYKLEAIDMGRRGIHNEGATLLMERLKDKIDMDFETARRFFTLICVLHVKGHRLLVG